MGSRSLSIVLYKPSKHPYTVHRWGEIMKRKRHLIALDLDGTLLSDTHTISEETKSILQQAINEGHIVIIATGRSHRNSIQYYDFLQLDTPMVNFNGAFIHHPYNNSWERTLHNPFPNQTAHHIIDVCYEINVQNILAEVQGNVYLERHDEQLMHIFQSAPVFEKELPFSIGSLKKQLTEDPTSILIYPRAEQVAQLTEHLNDNHATMIAHRTWDAPWNMVEIMKKGIHKAVGVKRVAEYYQIPRERIIAFGDEDNDLEMIDYAGIGVAMGNAIDELKQVAKHVTDTNMDEGVRTFLQTYFNYTVKVS